MSNKYKYFISFYVGNTRFYGKISKRIKNRFAKDFFSPFSSFMQLKKFIGIEPNKICSVLGNMYKIPISLTLKNIGMRNLEEFFVDIINRFSLLKRSLNRKKKLGCT